MRVRLPLVVSPPWLVTTVQGGIYLVGWTLCSWWLRHVIWWHAVVVGAVFSAILTTANWFADRRQRVRTELALASLTPDQRDQACQTLYRGPAPDDPVVRRAAVRLADARLEQSRRGQGAATVVLVLLALFCLLGVAADSPWWALGAAIVVAALVVLRLQPRRIERRLDTLLAPGRRGPGAGAVDRSRDRSAALVADQQVITGDQQHQIIAVLAARPA